MFKVKHNLQDYKIPDIWAFFKIPPNAKFNSKYRRCPEFSVRYGNPTVESEFNWPLSSIKWKISAHVQDSKIHAQSISLEIRK